jgi:hypothetical protein
VAAYPTEVSALLYALLSGVRNALSDNLLGFYLRGSLALGGFDPETSDVDMLVVTERPVSDAEFGALARLHRRVSPDGNEYGLRYDVSYIDRISIRRFEPGQRHPSSGTGLPFERWDHRPNWVLELWTVRERGVVIDGPEPKTLIDPISATAIREAVRDELLERLAHWSDGSWPAEEMAHRGAQVFEIETVCRALQTIATAELTTKAQAVAWALDTLGGPWRPLVKWSRGHRGDDTKDETKVPEVMSFLRWAVTRATTDA